MENPLTTATASAIAALVRDRQLSPVEVVAHFLDRIGRHNEEINAFVTIAEGAAMTDAHRAEAALLSGEAIGPLHGVPIAIKDLSATKGLTTTYGSLLQRDNVPDHDDIIVERLRTAGAIIIGKTTTPEYGWKATTESLLSGNTHNPWDLSRTSGGSSGGSAAAVAAHLVPIATGSDGGGSIRIPASFCGVYGIKPTFGRVPASYTGLGGWRVLAQGGPLTTNVRDAALILDSTSGPDSRDATCIADAPPLFERAIENTNLKGMRVAWTPDMDSRPIATEVRDICANAAYAFESLGASIEEAMPAVETGPSMDAFATMFLTDYAVSLGPLVAAGHGGVLPARFVEWITAAIQWPAARFARAMREREWHRRRFEEFFDSYDLLLMPTMATAAFPIEQQPSVIDGSPVDPMSGFTPFCYHANLAGLPAASIPCGFTKNGLPVGLQIIGAWGDEETVLRASAAFEEANPWAQHIPERFRWEPSD
jgi:Asp-tRNA(Asn)/Glu-tRNA(Gln) amidotransferase A subunit family amidase